MDELDILKNNWKKSQNAYPKYSNTEIYKMLHKKSSTVVKWILIVSIIELVIISLLDFFYSRTEENDYLLDLYHIDNTIKILTYLHYIIVIGFVFMFYKNFKRINVTDNLKNLMSNILTVKKTTNYYIIYNVSLMIIISVIYSIAAIMYDPKINELNSNNNLSVYIGVSLGLLVMFSIFIGLFYIVYKLIYGSLIKRLTKNYEELKKLDL